MVYIYGGSKHYTEMEAVCYSTCISALYSTTNLIEEGAFIQPEIIVFFLYYIYTLSIRNIISVIVIHRWSIKCHGSDCLHYIPLVTAVVATKTQQVNHEKEKKGSKVSDAKPGECFNAFVLIPTQLQSEWVDQFVLCNPMGFHVQMHSWQ